MKKQAFWQWLLKVAICLVLAAVSVQHVNEASIKGDATQNLKITKNLFFHQSFSLNTLGQTLYPTNFREPVPPFVTAVYLKLVLPDEFAAETAEWHDGPIARLAKGVNVIWTFWGLLAFLQLSLMFISRWWLGWLAFAASFLFFFDTPGVTNTLYTELPAATLMLTSTWAMATAFKAETKRSSVFLALTSGLLFGALCLTKTVFLVGIPAYLALLGWTLVGRSQHPASAPAPSRWRTLLIALVVFGCAITPWMLRNKAQLGTYEISSGRSGYVMLYRAYMDLMNDDEYRLGFALFGPNLFRTMVEGTSLALHPEDLKRGGRVQRLNYGAKDFLIEDRQSVFAARPDQSLTFYTKPAAEYQVLLSQYRMDRIENAALVADNILKKKAIGIFKSNLVKHLKVSALVMWSQFWIFSEHSLALHFGHPEQTQAVLVLINALTGLCLLGTFAFAIVCRDTRLALISGLPVLLILLHSLLTQGLPRLNVPVLPFMLLSFFVLSDRLLDMLTKQKSAGV